MTYNLEGLKFLQYLKGAHDDLIENPRILPFKHLFLVNLRGSEKTFPSFLLHFLLFFNRLLQQLFIYII